MSKIYTYGAATELQCPYCDLVLNFYDEAHDLEDGWTQECIQCRGEYEVYVSWVPMITAVGDE